MARSKNNLLLKQFSGQIGGQLVIKQHGNTTVLSKMPDMSKRKFSKKQLKAQEQMAEATYAAKGIMNDDKLRNAAQLRLNVTRNRLYPVCVYGGGTKACGVWSGA